jgi:tetratricopeptide (TPR) repeat protein
VQHASNPVPDDAEDPGASPAALAPKGGPALAAEGAQPGDAPHAVDTALSAHAAAQAPVAEDGERDPHFAARQPKKAESCDDVLGHPFELQPEPNAGKSGAFWSRSRRSLMHGQTARAVEQMCLSASWDLSGRGTFGLSEHYLREADFDQALAWAKRVPESSKRYADARTMLGDIYSQQGRVEQALAAYLGYWNLDADALDKRADLAVRFGNSAAMARRKGDWWTAERFYRRALVLDPDYAPAAAGLARVFAHFELHEATVYWAERALSLNEKDATQAAMALCTTWIHEKNPAEAEKALDTLRRIAPNHPILKSFARQISRL